MLSHIYTNVIDPRLSSNPDQTRAAGYLTTKIIYTHICGMYYDPEILCCNTKRQYHIPKDFLDIMQNLQSWWPKPDDNFPPTSI